MGFFRKLFSKLKASFYVFKKAEILRNVVSNEIEGKYDNLCHQCYFNERYRTAAETKQVFPDFSHLRIAIYLGGALGDYLVYLRFVDEISSICSCDVDLFLDRIGFGEFVYGKRENINIIHDAQNTLFLTSYTCYDLALHIDHGVILKHSDLGAIRVKASAFYPTACRIVETLQHSHIDVIDQHQRECVILRRAKFLGYTKWSLLSCGGAVNMEEMYSNVLLDPEWFSVLQRYDLCNHTYITINYGADKNMGGTTQTKLIPAKTLEGLISAFKVKHPNYLVVQTGIKGSLPLVGADRYAFDCRLEETAILLKYSTIHVDCEGGLVHLASQMSTPCVVAFGPTPSYYYGYPRNENVVSPACSDCMSVTSQWSRVCPRDMQIPVCMQAVTVQMLMDRIEKLLSVESTPASSESEGAVSTEFYTEQTKRMGRCVRICFISPLDAKLYETAKELKHNGNNVSLYIPIHLDADVIERRTQLKQAGIRVEYGNALNIAKPSASFDIVFCRADNLPVELHQYTKYECDRLTAKNGKIFWCYQAKKDNI
ncbi:MAG TPA: hypothetical protein VHP31_09455 [Caproicibacter sp.]|nr:hypothetical protein [Caproicibacter sp.]